MADTATTSKTITPEEAADRMLPAISPEELTAAVETPGAFKEIAKADLFMEMARLRRLMKNNSIPIGERLKYLQQLARMAGVDTAPVDASAGPDTGKTPNIQIVINGTPATQTAQTPPIDITPVEK